MLKTKHTCDGRAVQRYGLEHSGMKYVTEKWYRHEVSDQGALFSCKRRGGRTCLGSITHSMTRKKGEMRYVHLWLNNLHNYRSSGPSETENRLTIPLPIVCPCGSPAWTSTHSGPGRVGSCQISRLFSKPVMGDDILNLSLQLHEVQSKCVPPSMDIYQNGVMLQLIFCLSRNFGYRLACTG